MRAWRLIRASVRRWMSSGSSVGAAAWIVAAAYSLDHAGVVPRDLALWFGTGATALLTPPPPDPGGTT